MEKIYDLKPATIDDLEFVKDAKITTIFDYAILERPIICFAYDLDAYSQERGFAMDIRAEMPGGVAETEKDVIARIQTIDIGQERMAVKAFKNKYIEFGGNATEICVNALFTNKK